MIAQPNPLTHAPRHYYHGSPAPLRVGSVLRGRKKQHMSYGVERLVESVRPQGAPSRLSSIFMVGRSYDTHVAGGADEFVYEVIPSADVIRVHSGWLGEVMSIHNDLQTRKEAARNYWASKPYPDDFEKSPWEYLASAVRVVRLVSTVYPEDYKRLTR